MTGLEILAAAKAWKWISEHKAEALGIGLAAAVVIAGVVAWGSWYYRGVKLRGALETIQQLEGKIKAAGEREAGITDMLARSNQSAKEWEAAALKCDAGTAALQLEADRQRQARDMERRRLAAEREARREAEARLAEAITATDCEDAVQQLAEVLR